MDSGLYKSLAEVIKNDTKMMESWMRGLGLDAGHINPLFKLIRFNTEILEPSKYSNHLLRALLLDSPKPGETKQQKKTFFLGTLVAAETLLVFLGKSFFF